MPVTLIKSKWSSGNLIFFPATDDSGAINFGDGTNDCDVKFFLGSTSEYAEFDVGNSRLNIEGVPIRFSNPATSVFIATPSSGTIVSPSAAGAGSAMGYFAVTLGDTVRYVYTYQTPA